MGLKQLPLYISTILIVIVLSGCSAYQSSSPSVQSIPEITLPTSIGVSLDQSTPLIVEKENEYLAVTATSPTTALIQSEIKTEGSRLQPTPTNTQLATLSLMENPTAIYTPTVTTRQTPTRTPTPRPPTPVPQDAMIRIFSPSSGSKVISPIHVLAAVAPGAGGNVHLRLIGEQNRLILEKDWIFSGSGGRRINIDQKFEFTVQGVAESARLIIYTLDAQNRILSLASEDLLLLSIGGNDLTEALDLLEPFQLLSPQPEEYIHHGNVKVYGIMHSQVTSRVIIDLVDENGEIVGSITLPELLAPNIHYQVLDVVIPYSVKSGTWARLTMRLQNPMTGEDRAISSFLLRLYP